MRPARETKRTLPKRKPAKGKTSAEKPAGKKSASKKAKVKPLFTLKGIPAKYKTVCTVVLAHATSQAECDELLLAGVSAFENLHDTESPETAAQLELQVVTKAILLKKETFTSIA